MKKFIRDLLVFVSFCGPVWAAPFCAIGNNAELFVTGQAGVRFDDNILLAPAGPLRKSDTIASFTPGLDLEFGKDSLVKGALTASESFNAYFSNSELNSQLATVNFNAAYSTEKTKLTANAAYTQSDQNSYSANGSTISSNTYSGGLNGEYSISPKTSFGTGVTFSRTEYLNSPTSVGEKNYGVPLNAYYSITPKSDISAGVTYNRSDLDNGLSYDDFYYNVGARGEFSPKLNGSFSVGWDDRTGSGGPLAQNNSSLGFHSGLTYIYSDKTAITFSADRGFTNASSGSSTQKNLGIVLGAKTDIATDWKLSASLTYRDIQYEGVAGAGRVDDYLEATFGATYAVNSKISLNGAYTYRNLSTNTPGDFANNVIAVSVSARY